MQAAGASAEAPIVDFVLHRLSIVVPAKSRWGLQQLPAIAQHGEKLVAGALPGVGSVTASVNDPIGHRGSAMISGTLVSRLTDLSEVLRCKHTPSRVAASQDCMCVSGESETLSRFCSFSDYLKSASSANDINSAIEALKLKRPTLMGWSYAGFTISDCVRRYRDQATSRVSLSVFEAHGNNHPLVGRYRAQLSSLL